MSSKPASTFSFGNPLFWIAVVWPVAGAIALAGSSLHPVGRGLVWFGLTGPVYLASVFLHELGHAATGSLAGLSVRSLRIGPLLLRADRHWRLGLDWNADGLRVGRTEFDWAGELQPRARSFAAVLGGPLANAVAFGVCTVAARSVSPGSLAGDALIVGRLVNAWCCLSNLVPLRLSSGLCTDGATLLQLLRPPTPAQQWVQRLRRRALTLRPSAWGVTVEALLETSKADDLETRVTLLWSALAVAHDSGDFALGEQLIAGGLSLPKLDPAIRAELQAQRVLRTALVDRDRVAARKALSALEGGAPTPLRTLAEAAVLLSERHLAAARTAYEDWRRLTDGTRPGSRDRSGYEWAMDRIEGKLKKASAA